ncbi:16S rRNA (cytidine(1402)-2'-O)-methyltransferase [Demequina activiva]|uniref:Ribosomal RNA small subunit methyltransferase I n=1 Tax=Demequina activiva TaxID=1582364 RepID=A0A919Q4H0_9MICO|nr:16S rRNA (cytidine(1402)-2'-O)-methyltransferase [Demequina activiva]GIG53675.1 ribosomal RNA small subunit methyltransferase I [Demequina activiva]
MTGRIVVAATPIGNADDASARLRDTLASADVIAAEDTRRLRDLARRLGVELSAEIIAVHDHNEGDRAPGLVERARAGAQVLVVSDAGMPTVSDPGFRVVEAAVAGGVDVTVLPGPSAVLTALALSGLPTDRFCFEGFVPRKAGERSRALAALAAEPRTLVFFEAPHRLEATLDDMARELGAQRQAAVCRELTKTYEEVHRAPLADLATWARETTPRGEIVIVVGGRAAEAPSVESLVAEALARIASGERAKDAVADLAQAGGVPRRDLYAAVLQARDQARDQAHQSDEPADG